MNVKPKTNRNDLNLIRQIGLNALAREPGACGMVSFLRQFETGYGDYTKERRQTLADISIDEIVSNIKKKKICTR